MEFQFFGLVSRSLLVPMFDSKFTCLGLLNRGFRMDSGVYFCCFLEALGAFFLVFAALQTGLKIDAFLVV